MQSSEEEYRQKLNKLFPRALRQQLWHSPPALLRRRHTSAVVTTDFQEEQNDQHNAMTSPVSDRIATLDRRISGEQDELDSSTANNHPTSPDTTSSSSNLSGLHRLLMSQEVYALAAAAAAASAAAKANAGGDTSEEGWSSNQLGLLESFNSILPHLSVAKMNADAVLAAAAAAAALATSGSANAAADPGDAESSTNRAPPNHIALSDLPPSMSSNSRSDLSSLALQRSSASASETVDQQQQQQQQQQHQMYCLRWNNHQTNLMTVLDRLMQTESFCDVTIACDAKSVKCHKIILSACSAYFHRLLSNNSCAHPIIFLKDIKFEDMKAILQYMYRGEVNVRQAQLPGLLKLADILKVKGLVEDDTSDDEESLGRDETSLGERNDSFGELVDGGNNGSGSGRRTMAESYTTDFRLNRQSNGAPLDADSHQEMEGQKEVKMESATSFPSIRTRLVPDMPTDLSRPPATDLSRPPPSAMMTHNDNQLTRSVSSSSSSSAVTAAAAAAAANKWSWQPHPMLPSAPVAVNMLGRGGQGGATAEKSSSFDSLPSSHNFQSTSSCSLETANHGGSSRLALASSGGSNMTVTAAAAANMAAVAANITSKGISSSSSSCCGSSGGSDCFQSPVHGGTATLLPRNLNRSRHPSAPFLSPPSASIQSRGGAVMVGGPGVRHPGHNLDTSRLQDLASTAAAGILDSQSAIAAEAVKANNLFSHSGSDDQLGNVAQPGSAANARLEWKRYKQYTRTDIMNAIEEVKNGMSALQASRLYKVPSRTLYDKVKKMGISTGRQMTRKNGNLPYGGATLSLPSPISNASFNQMMQASADELSGGHVDESDHSHGASADVLASDLRRSLHPREENDQSNQSLTNDDLLSSSASDTMSSPEKNADVAKHVVINPQSNESCSTPDRIAEFESGTEAFSSPSHQDQEQEQKMDETTDCTDDDNPAAGDSEEVAAPALAVPDLVREHDAMDLTASVPSPSDMTIDRKRKSIDADDRDHDQQVSRDRFAATTPTLDEKTKRQCLGAAAATVAVQPDLTDFKTNNQQD